ncbi:sodium channel subunit beta-3 [Protopterus annectens]|uniref:sodium channel subunit beta-3 n=1 Tax=Protopterus annectens TaxID=7888 RepID=UPI001CFBC9C3|nr:sodium channel subunit beta-3 [Protopterus annectens]
MRRMAPAKVLSCLLIVLLLLIFVATCQAVCVEVLSETEAVVGSNMKLLCISCKKREEVNAITVVEWFHKAYYNDTDILIAEYREGFVTMEGSFTDRLRWNGSRDLQDVSIVLLNVTTSDSGIYTCNVTRTFEFDSHRLSFQNTKNISLTVLPDGKNDFTSYVSEIMMYILLVFLTVWLLVEMLYCYRKISKSEEVTQESQCLEG